MRKILLLAAGFALLTPSVITLAQDSNILLNAPGLIPKKPSPGLPDVKPHPLAWPRLDPGAIICRSENDLSRLAARRRGEPVEGSSTVRSFALPRRFPSSSARDQA